MRWFPIRGQKTPKSDFVKVHCFSDFFVAQREEGSSVTINSSEIDRIVTYKMDCYAYDTIWLVFVLKENNQIIALREEVTGLQELIKWLVKVFPTIDIAWYEKVAQPPFAKNFTVLYERKGET